MSAGRITLALLLLATALPAGAQQPDTTADGTLTVRVVDDGGHSIPNASVSATPMGDFDYLKRSTGMTDDDGKLVLDDLSPVPYGVYAEAAGYVMADRENRERYRVGQEVNIRMVKGGVITGTVTGAEGEPLVGVVVRTQRVRGLEAGDDDPEGGFSQRLVFADDRGIYRIFGLSPGVYVVFACGGYLYGGTGTAYDDDAPTYYPSAMRPAAVEIRVQPGEEVRGIDIRHRGAEAHAIRGTLAGAAGKSGSLAWVAVYAPDGSQVTVGQTRYESDPWRFTITGVADGEYTLRATRYGDDDGAETESRKVTVKGADVANVALSFVEYGSLEGRVVLDPPDGRPAECELAKGSRRLEESVLAFERESPGPKALLGFGAREAAPGREGAFTVKMLQPTRYRIEAQPGDEDWYVAAMTVGKAAQKRPADGIEVASGRRVSDVEVRLARGAASVRGKVAVPEGVALPARLVVHLVPADPKLATETIRYREVEMERDGAFTIANVAPGKYWLLTALPLDSSAAKPGPRRAAWAADTRAALRRAAEKGANAIDLAPCQRADAVTVRYTSVTVR